MAYDNLRKSKLAVNTMDIESHWEEAFILEKSLKYCDLCQSQLSLWESYSIDEDYICCSTCKEEYGHERERLALEERHKEMMEGKSFILVSRPSTISLNVSPIKIIIENYTFNKSYESLLSIGDYKEISVEKDNKYILKAYISPYNYIEALSLHIEMGESIYIEIQPISLNSTSVHCSSKVLKERISCKIIKREVVRDGKIHSFSSC